MNIYNTVFLVLYLAILTDVRTGTAQTLKDKIYFSYGGSPSTSFKLGGGGTQFTHTYDLQLGPPPIKISTELKWINSFSARMIKYNFTELPENLSSLSSTLYDVQYGSIFIYKPETSRWSLLGAPRMLLRSDFKGQPFSRSIFFSGLLLANFNPDGEDRLVWSFGIAFANDFNKNALVPVAGLTLYDKRYTIEISYPRINVLYKPMKCIEWGITAAINGGIFSTRAFNLPAAETSVYTRVINATIGNTFNYLLSEKLVFSTCIGYNFLSNYDLMDSSVNTIDSIQTDLRGNLFFRSGMSVRL